MVIKMFIYKITNLITGKQYVGQTVRPIKKRWSCHGYNNYYIANSIKKYGKKKFKIEVLEQCESTQQLNQREIYWIKEINTLYPNGYNLTEGGEGASGRIISDETKKKMSEAQKGSKNPFYGKKLSTEHRRKISEAKKGKKGKKGRKSPMFGKKHTEESKRKNSETQKGSKNHFYGKKHSTGTKRKISEAIKRYHANNKGEQK